MARGWLVLHSALMNVAANSASEQARTRARERESERERERERTSERVRAREGEKYRGTSPLTGTLEMQGYLTPMRNRLLLGPYSRTI